MEGRKFLHFIPLQILYLSCICDFQQVTGQYFYTTTEDYYQPTTREYHRPTTRDYYRQSTRDYYRPITRDYYLLSTYDYFGSTRGYFLRNCQVENQASGEIYSSSYYGDDKCWKIEVPPNSYVRLNVTELLTRLHCIYAYVKIQVAGTGEEFIFCSEDRNRQPIIALNDVLITYSNANYSMKFRIRYNIENLICAQKEHFRCSNYSCIHRQKVCDGVEDCENGSDERGCETGVVAVDGAYISRENSIRWLRRQWSTSFGWGRNTHRAITAIYLAGAAGFGGNNIEMELMAKQLELQTSIALLRNSTDPLSVSDLSMFINALTVTCHNPRQFYGTDLLQTLGERVVALKTPSPAAYLTLCNGNWSFTESHIRSLLRTLHTHSEYPFHLDVQAMTVMALSCMRNKTKIFEGIKTATELYNSTIHSFIYGQLHDGSFGNVYTTALVAQALLSSGKKNNKLWKINSTIKYLMKELHTSTDFLSVYLTLPIFSGKSLIDIANVNCTNFRKHGEDDEIMGITNKLGGKVRIQYSLYLGNQKQVIHTMYLKMSENSSAYEVMKLAQVVDHKYKFQHRDLSGNIYVYTIAGITNDPEAGKFWLLYTGDSHINGTVHHHTKSPNKLMLADGDHLIMWYKTADI